MIIDKEGKLFGKISIIDIIIILVVIVGVVGVFYKFNIAKSITPFTKTDKIQITFYTDETQAFNVKGIKVGDIVKDSIKNAVFGKITSIKTDKSVSFAANEKGEFVKSTKDGYVSVMITVEGKGIYSDSGATFSNSDYSVGKKLTDFVAGKSTYITYIYDIKKIGE